MNLQSPNFMRYRYMGHDCPTCEVDVYGYLRTKTYCSDKCRSKFNKLKEKQLLEPCESLTEFQKKNYEVMRFVMGDTKDFFVTSLYSLQKKNFRPDEYCSKAHHLGIRVFVVGSFCYFIKSELVYVFRTSKMDDLFEGIAARWKLDFPELGVIANEVWKGKVKEMIKTGMSSRNFESDLVLFRREFWDRALGSFHRKLGVWRI